MKSRGKAHCHCGKEYSIDEHSWVVIQFCSQKCKDKAELYKGVDLWNYWEIKEHHDKKNEQYKKAHTEVVKA